MPTRVIVRAVRERADEIAYLRERLPHAEWCFDRRRDAMDTFMLALWQAGDDACVHMEDDTILTVDFSAKLEAAIAQRPGEVIQFFSMRRADVTLGSRWDRSFLMGQCFYLPPGSSRELWQFGAEWPGITKDPTGLDTMVCDWLRSRRRRYWIHVPSLVDHRVGVSMIDRRRSSKRQSLTFTDAA